jgi:hypothetical protein
VPIVRDTPFFLSGLLLEQCVHDLQPGPWQALKHQALTMRDSSRIVAFIGHVGDARGGTPRYPPLNPKETPYRFRRCGGFINGAIAPSLTGGCECPGQWKAHDEKGPVAAQHFL